LNDEAALKDFAKTLTEPEVDNPLWGIPYFAKDNFSTKGIPTTALRATS
jgi:Asp-tRNA(Asn)/Glu-tRNA(Gln) amidotransferase A subunit family amidase